MIFEVFKDRKKEYRFRIKAKNGKIIAQSEGYNRKSACTRFINNLKTIILDGRVDAIKVKDV